jgi:LysR family transcriptional regulator for metE and metH
MLEMRHFRTLVALAETRKLTAAASRVHLTQSALSHQVRAIEDEYGPIFDRRRSGLEFTATGDRLLQLARQTLESVAIAERDLARMKDAAAGQLRIALECHTCFDWLMPVMDRFRPLWPEVELDLVAGFHTDAIELLESRTADMVIGARPPKRKGLTAIPLFRFEILAVLPVDSPLGARKRVEARDFSGQTLITYPVPDKRIDVIREVLAPARIKFRRRTTELTVAILQLVASRRGIAALPAWGLVNYVGHDYVIARPIGAKGLHADLYAIGMDSLMTRAFAREFVSLIRECAPQLPGAQLIASRATS